MPIKSHLESVADKNPAPHGVAAVDRALTLLSVFTTHDQALSLTQLSARTGMYKSTVLRLLASLVHARFLHITPQGHYALGVELTRLNSIYLRNFGQAHLIYPVLQALMHSTQESVAYSVAQGTGEHAQRVCVYRVESQQVLRDHIREGEVLPLHRGTGGRVLVAFAPAGTYPIAADEIDLYARIRAQGYFAGVGDRSPDLGGIAAPVFDVQGQLRGSLTLTMPASRFNSQHISLVVSAAQALKGKV